MKGLTLCTYQPYIYNIYEVQFAYMTCVHAYSQVYAILYVTGPAKVGHTKSGLIFKI